MKGAAVADPLPSLEERVGKCEQQLASELAIPLKELGTSKVRAAVLAELQARGFEQTKSFVRVPLSRQLEARLVHGGRLRANAIQGALVGAAKSEAKPAAAQLVLEGRAQWVVRGGDLTLVGVHESVLGPAECRGRAQELDTLAKALKKAATGKAPVALLRADLLDELSELVRQLAPEVRDPSKGAAQSGDGKVVDAVRQLRDASSKLAWVPDVIRRLGDSADGRELLLRAARERKIELRPEGGLSRLADADRLLCPVGAGGAPLSWARLLEDTHG